MRHSATDINNGSNYSLAGRKRPLPKGYSPIRGNVRRTKGFLFSEKKRAARMRGEGIPYNQIENFIGISI